MPIFKDKDTQLATPPSTNVGRPLCPNGMLSQDFINSFKGFVDELSPSNTGSIKRKLFDKVFIGSNPSNPNFSFTSIGGSNFSLNPVLNKQDIPFGFLAEGVEMAVMWHLKEVLELVSTGVSNNQGENITVINSDLRTQALLDDSQQHQLFIAMKNVLIRNGFIAPESTNEKMAFNKLFFPNIKSGERNIAGFGEKGTKGRLFNHMVINNRELNPNNSSANYRPNKSRFDFKDLGIMVQAKTLSGDDKQVFLLEEHEKLLAKIFNEWDIVKRKIIRELAQCLFKKILPGNNLPEGKAMAIGDGSDTAGLLNEPSKGVILFDYEFRTGTEVRVMPIFGVRHFAESRQINQQFFKSPGKGKKVIIHLDTFGVNQVLPLVEVAINGVVTTFTDVNGLLKPINSEGERPSFVFEEIGGIFSIRDKPNSPFNEIARYDSEKQDLCFTDSTGTDIVITLKTASNNSVEELVLLANIVALGGPGINRFSLDSENLFMDDRFELNIAEKNAFIPFSLFEHDLDFLTVALATLNITPTTQLNGQFVGKKATKVGLHLPEVKRDESYVLFRSLFTTIPPQTQVEVQIPPAAGSNLALQFEKLRYSFLLIDVSQAEVNIKIDSWVSPLRSRLDKKFADDYRNNSAHPDFPGLTPGPILSQLKALTLFGDAGENPAVSDAFLLEDESNTSSTKFPSYNQVLSALRSFGLLEALVHRINQHAQTLTGLTPSQITGLATKLDTMLTNAKVETITTVGGPLFITRTEYDSFKWYTSANEKVIAFGNPP